MLICSWWILLAITQQNGQGDGRWGCPPYVRVELQAELSSHYLTPHADLLKPQHSTSLPKGSTAKLANYLAKGTNFGGLMFMRALESDTLPLISAFRNRWTCSTQTFWAHQLPEYRCERILVQPCGI